MSGARHMLRWWFVLAAGALAACAGVVPFLVDARDRIKVPHERHAKADVDCVSCHETIFDAVSLDTRNLPKEKKCLECHKEQKQKGNCGFCHSNPEHPQTYAPVERELKMNHTAHLERTKEDCAVCHQRLPAPFAQRENAPTMQACTGCHEHQAHFDEGNCQLCHKDLSRYPSRPVFAFSHQGNYVKQHRLEARAGAQCAQCHEQTFCSDCHSSTVSRPIELKLLERTDRNFIHRSDFEGRHSVEARADGATCQRCHGASFCQDCHTQRGLTPLAERSQNPHPAGFGAKGSTAFHGAAARRDIGSCAACHDQGAASNCVDCHRVGGVGGNPHPPSWTARHRTEEVGRNAMCQVCHR